MQVEEFMNKPVTTCLNTDSLDDAAGLMWEYGYGALPVVDRRGRILGIITDRDICLAAYSTGERLANVDVAEVASTDVVALRDTDQLEEADVLMNKFGIRRLPVLDASNRVVGMISRGDLVMIRAWGFDDSQSELAVEFRHS